MRTADLDPAVVLEWLNKHFHVRANWGRIFWKLPPANHARLLNQEAGSFRRNHSGKRYCHIKMGGIAIKRGWLVFLYKKGRWPNGCLDHKDGNSEFDGIANLREATITQNAQNHKSRARRINLPMGVRYTPGGRYQARIGINKKQVAIGVFDTPEEARAAYLRKRKEAFGEFA